jgi:protein phosphatase
MHPGIATVYEVFEDSQRLFILSEYVEGHFLADMGSPISRKDIFDITFRGCEILDFLHEQGVILGSLGKEQVVLHDGEVMFHDLDFAAFQGQITSEAQQKIHVERLGRMVREFIPPDLPALRALFDEVAEARITSTTSLARNLRALSARLPSADGPTHYAGMSDVGMVRTLNEDNWGWEKISEDVSIYVVADGMGGHDGGEIASELAVKTIIAGVRRRLKERPTPDDRTLENLLDEAFQEANNTIKGFSEKRRSDMGTTLVGILLNQRSKLAYVANVGDSRCYLVRGSELMQLTQDHSLVANLVAMGKISKQAAKNHPHSNILIRTVGKEWDIEIDIFRQDFKPGDLFLLCSDGLWGEVDEADILALIRDNPEPRAACQELVRAANRHGGHDNVTALVVKTN